MIFFLTNESQTRCCSLFWRFLGYSWSVCISKLHWQRSFCKDPSGRRWCEALSCVESQMWLSASLASSAGMLLETSGYGQIRENFHNYLFGKHPAEYGNFGCVGDSWDSLEQFDCFAGTGTAVWNGLGLLFFLPVFTGDEPVSDQFAVVLGRAAHSLLLQVVHPRQGFTNGNARMGCSTVIDHSWLQNVLIGLHGSILVLTAFL